MIARRERGRTALQTTERSTKRANAEKVLREEDARLALIEAQKVKEASKSGVRLYVRVCVRFSLGCKLRSIDVAGLEMPGWLRTLKVRECVRVFLDGVCWY